MRILMLTQWFHPEPGPRVHELAVALHARGHEVTVLTGYPSYPTDAFYPGYKVRGSRVEDFNGVRVIRVPHFPHAPSSAFRRSLNYGSFCLSSLVYGLFRSGPFDCMYVLFPPPLLGFTSFVIGALRGAPRVYDILDIWPDAAVATGLLGNPFLIGLLRAVEWMVYPLAAAISVPSPGYKVCLTQKKRVPPHKIHVIPQWEDGEVYRPVPRDPALVSRYGTEGRFVVTYAGNLGHAQGLGVLLDAAECLKTEESVLFLIAGDGADGDSLRASAEARGLTNVRFLGRLEVEEMAPLFSLSGLGVVHLKRNPVFALTIPRKAQSYMACGCPVLMAVEGVGATMIRETDTGLTCPPEDGEAMAETIQSFRSRSEAERASMRERARRIFLERYESNQIMDRFEALLASLTSTTPHGANPGKAVP